jgi:hypothetical protein
MRRAFQAGMPNFYTFARSRPKGSEGLDSGVHVSFVSSTLSSRVASMASRFPPPLPLPEVSANVSTFECDACGKTTEGEAAGHGLYVWTRGDEIRYEEPPLCSHCANAIGLAALAQWELEEDGE